MIETENIQSNKTDLLTAQTSEYVLNIFNREAINQKLVFHNLKTTIQLVGIVKTISEGEMANSDDQSALVLAAWFVYTGFLKNYQKPAPASVSNLKAFVKTQNLDENIAAKSQMLIGQYFNPTSSDTKIEAIFKDAITVLNFGAEYKTAQSLRQYEQELHGLPVQDRLSSQNARLANILTSQLYTPFAIKEYGQVINQNILSTRKQVQKLDPESGIEDGVMLFDGIENGIPNRGIQSYFRSIYRVHINLSAIADNKANIMISVNAILISVLISLLSYKNISETNPRILLPVVMFIISGLSSLIFAVLSARPRVTYPNKDIVDRNILKKNTIFFGSFVTMKLDQFESLMDEVFKDGKLIYGNMVRDMYFLGKVLDKKYQYLIISYNIFMVGFAVTVISFLIILFL